MKHKIKLLPLAVAGALFTAGAAHAEGFSFNGGYFRAGAAAGAKKGHDRTCYQAPGSEWKYRLGNECDYYGEFMFSYGVGKQDETQYNIYWMPNYYQGGVSDATSLGQGQTTNVHVEQAYGEIKSPDFAKNVTFWAGSRFYGRQNGNEVDTFLVNMSGTGAGADIALGGGMKFGVAYFRSDANGAAVQPAPLTFGGASSTGAPGTRVNLDLTGVPAGPNNTLRFTGAYTKGDFNASATAPVIALAGTNGYAFSVQDTLDPFLGGQNFFWIQYAQGSAYLNDNFGNLTDGSDVKHYRVADSLNWQITPVFGGEAFAAYQEDKCAASCSATALNQGSLKHYSIGVRPAWGLTTNFKLQGEVGFDIVKPGAASGIGTINMSKLTIAPTVSFGSTYWSRPEIRFYVTTAHWNTATNLASGPTGYGDLGGNTNGTSYGFQLEAWW